MTSEKQLLANQVNAAHSTGPRTPEGKAVSSLNGTKHNLTGAMQLLPEEDQLEYARHCETTIASLHPESDLERHVAQAIADDYWRVARARIFSEAITNQALANNEEPDIKKINLYAVYESRLARNIKNNLAELRRLREDRINHELDMQERAEAARLKEFVARNRRDIPTTSTPDATPAPANGFGFSEADSARRTAEIERRAQALAREKYPNMVFDAA